MSSKVITDIQENFSKKSLLSDKKIPTVSVKENGGEELRSQQKGGGASLHTFLEKFYHCSEKTELRDADLNRIREIQQENDQFQREIFQRRKSTEHCADNLGSLAEIEHFKILIAKNAGEILKFYKKNRERLNKIQELEQQNISLNMDAEKEQELFIEALNIEERAQHAAKFFFIKESIAENKEEILRLSGE